MTRADGGRAASVYEDVLALSLFDAATLDGDQVVESSRLWLGARDPATNMTHPDVVSVPTRRIPRGAAEDILTLGGLPEVSRTENGTLYEYPCAGWMRFSFGRVAAQESRGWRALRTEVERLLREKLVPASAADAKSLIYRARLETALEGFAYYPNFEKLDCPPYPVHEPLRMINVRVDVCHGKQLLRSPTKSYREIRWVTVGQFCEMMQGRDVQAAGFDGFRYCVDGLCIDTTNVVIQRSLKEFACGQLQAEAP